MGCVLRKRASGGQESGERRRRQPAGGSRSRPAKPCGPSGKFGVNRRRGKMEPTWPSSETYVSCSHLRTGRGTALAAGWESPAKSVPSGKVGGSCFLGTYWFL